MRTALIPGSFDPITVGHLDIIKRAAEKYERVVVAVMVNPAKKYLFSMKERVELAKLTVKELPNVEVISDRGMLIDLFDKVGAYVVCKGYRNRWDYTYEQKMADWNKVHNPRVKTELMEADEKFETVSSTKVRELLFAGKIPVGLVAPAALDLLVEYYSNRT